MKLKYYLRGAGIGIIFATIIMTVSSVIHNNNLSDETIIKEAMKLGMVMPSETEEDGGLWASAQDTETEDVPEVTEADTSMPTEGDVPEDTQQITENQPPADTQIPQNTQIPQDTQTPQIPLESETPTSEQVVTNVPVGTLVEITVKDGDAARQVAETLYANGLIPDAEEFRLYLGAMGYANHIYSGTFQIPMGATYEEICSIIIKKQF